MVIRFGATRFHPAPWIARVLRVVLLCCLGFVVCSGAQIRIAPSAAEETRDEDATPEESCRLETNERALPTRWVTLHPTLPARRCDQLGSGAGASRIQYSPLFFAARRTLLRLQI